MTKNPFRIIYEGRHNILKPIYWVLWTLVTIFIISTNLITNYDPLIDISQINIANFIVYSGMGLNIAIIISIIGILYFNKQEYKDMFAYDKNLVNKAIAPYLFVLGIWVMNITVSLLANINTLPIQSDMLNIIKVLFIAMIILGLLGNLSLIITYFRNIYYTRQRNKKKH